MFKRIMLSLARASEPNYNKAQKTNANVEASPTTD